MPIAFDLSLIAIAVVAAFWRILFTSAFFDVSQRPTDWTMLAQPAYTYSGQSLVRGEFPLWNTHWFAGYPHFAVPSNSVLYPTTILYGLFDFSTASKILAVGHVYIFAALSYALGRNLYRSRFSALFLALGAVLGSTMHWPLSAGNLWTITTLIWLPLAFLALRKILATGSLAWALALAPTIALMVFGGDPVTLAFALITLGVYTVCIAACALVKRSEPLARVFTNSVIVVAALIAGLALAAIQLVPAQEFIEQSVRKNGVTFQYWGGHFSFTLFDSYRIATIESLASISYVDGKVVLALTFVALAGLATREAWAFWIVTALFWVLGETPEWFFEAVLRHIPVLNGIRGSTPYALTTIYLSYLLAGSGLDTLIASVTSSRVRRAPWIVACAASAGFLLVAAINDPRFAVTIITVALLLVLAAAVFWRPPPRAAIALVLFALVATECVSRFGIESYTGDPKRLEVNGVLNTFSESREDLDRIVVLGSNQSGIRQGPAVAMLTGDRNIEGYHALFLHRYARLLRDVAGVSIAKLDAEGRLDEQGDYGVDWINSTSLPVLDLLNVRYILRNGAFDPFLKSEIDRRSGKFTFEIVDRMRIYKNHTALPPMFPIHDIVFVSDEDEAVALLRSGTFDYRKRATLVIDVMPVVAPATGPEPITLIQYSPNAIEAKASLTAPALLILSEMWYPGWYAQIDDGPPVPTLCVDVALQATPVPAGDHTVRFFFHPRSVITGAIISGAACAVWILAAALVLFRRKPSAPINSPKNQQ